MSNEWNGEGLPTVGCECIVSYEDGSLGKNITVRYAGPEVVVGRDEDGREYGYLTSIYKFSPIQTQADKEREEAVRDLSDVINGFIGISMKQSTAVNMAGFLLNNGYRLPVEQDEVVSLKKVVEESRDNTLDFDSFVAVRFIITRKPKS